MKKLLLLLTFIIGGSLLAQSAYWGVGTGLQFNLGDLGSTITKDGLDNSTGDQQIIIPENKIDVWAKSGFVKRNTSGLMTGLILNAFYEQESGTGTFWRAGFDYTKKILGGRTTADLIGYRIVDQSWDFSSWYISGFFGIKAGVGESSAVYGAIGLNYYRGGWSLRGTVDGATPCTVGLALNTYSFCNFGPWGDAKLREVVKTAQLNGVPAQSIVQTYGRDAFYKGAIFGEEIVFDVHGIGYNLLIGFENKLQNNSKWYIEIEYLVAGKMDNAPVNSMGTVTQIAPTGNISYPINLSGARWKFGIKRPL